MTNRRAFLLDNTYIHKTTIHNMTPAEVFFHKIMTKTSSKFAVCQYFAK